MNINTNSKLEKCLYAPEYDEAWSNVLHQAVQGIVFQDSVFGMLQRVETSHHGPIRNVRSPQTLDQPYSGAEYSANMLEDDLRHTRIDKHSEFICNMAESAKREMGPQLFQNIAEITAASDMDFDLAGQPFSSEIYLRTLEKMDIDFDDTGQPMLPKLVCHPSTGKKLEQTIRDAEQKPRYHELLMRKREEFLAKKRTRRLS